MSWGQAADLVADEAGHGVTATHVPVTSKGLGEAGICSCLSSSRDRAGGGVRGTLTVISWAKQL